MQDYKFKRIEEYDSGLGWGVRYEMSEWIIYKHHSSSYDVYRNHEFQCNVSRLEVAKNLAIGTMKLEAIRK